MSNIHKLIEHLVNNWTNNLSEALAPRVKQQLMDKFKQEADDYNITIDDRQLSDYIDYFDSRLKNNPKVTEKDLAKYPIKSLIKLVSAYKGSSKEDEEDTENIPDVVYNENGIIIYSGHNEENCLKFGKGEQWCITRGAFANYRYDSNRKNPTFYLVKDTNLPDRDRKSFFVVVVGSDNTYKVSDRSNNDVGGRGTEWNRWEPWSFVEQQFPSVQGLQRIFRYVPISRAELATRNYASRPMSVEEWEVAPPDFKERYLIIRKGNALFNDISNAKFIRNILPDNQDMATMIAKNYGIIDLTTLLEEFDSFSNQNQKSIIANASRFTKLNPRALSYPTYPFTAKKAIVRGKLLEAPNNERYYISVDDKAIIKLKFNNDDLSMGVFYEKESYPEVKINERTNKILKLLPRFDEIPFNILLKLIKENILPRETVSKVIEKSKEENSNSAIISANTDEGEIILDTNTLKAYKPENGEYKQVPFEDESVQNILTSEEIGSGIQDGIVRMFTGLNRNIEGVSIPIVISILNQTPIEKRIIRQGDNSFIIVPNRSRNQIDIWKSGPAVLSNRYIDFYVLENGRMREGRNADAESWASYFNYLRSANLAYNSEDLLNKASDKYYAGENFIKSNPPLTEDNPYKIAEYEGTWYLVNPNNLETSRKFSATGNLLKAKLNARTAAQILGTTPPVTPARTRQPRTATATTTPTTAAPEAGEANTATATVIEEYGLTAGVNALPASFRNRILTGQVVATDNGFQGRNRALGNRGQVVRIIANGSNRMYIIRLASGTYIAQASFQPDARHYIITTDAAFNMGRVGNFIDTLAARNLAEGAKDILSRLALSAATKEELDEIKSNSKKKPYKNVEITESYIIREFDENIDPIELKWHRDREDRIVEIVGKTDWKLQLENQLPISMNEPISIPKGEWHRVIKGTGKLTLKIIKEESTQYTFAGVLVTNTSTEDGRPQKDILSDIRAIEGITIVTSKDYDASGEMSAFNNPNYYSIIKVKVDPNPYKTGFTTENLENMLKELRAIKGVKNFKLNQAVEKTTV